MPVVTIAFCDHCKWRSSPQTAQLDIAGAPCPVCGSGVSALHCDPSYTATDQTGRKYVEADEMAAHLSHRGVSPVDPPHNVPLPKHRT